MSLSDAIMRQARSLQRAFDPRHRAFKQMVKRYKRERSAGTVTHFPWLTGTSVVFDFGGYKGDWTAAVAQSQGAEFHVFEPHPSFAATLARRFANDPRIRVHDFALASRGGTFTLSDNLDASSVHGEVADGIVCRSVAVTEFFADRPLSRIDVMKMNIEGGEYDLLPALLDGGHVERIGTLLVQFHNFGPSDPSRREAIRKRLARTHDCDWCYDFVWEQWSLKQAISSTDR